MLICAKTGIAMSKQRHRIIQLLTAACLLLAVATIHAADEFPGGKPDRQIIKMQQKVDSLFEKGDYERAYFINREELVPLGDKYAQYMVGYMTMVGKGVPQDVIGGSAWYRLAAERGDASFVQARDEVLRLLNDEQRKSSDQRYFELRLDFSDAMIVTNMIEKDLRAFKGRNEANDWARSLTGGEYVSSSAFAKENAELIARVEQLLSFLAKATATPGLLTVGESKRIRSIESRANDVLRSNRSQD